MRISCWCDLEQNDPWKNDESWCVQQHCTFQVEKLRDREKATDEQVTGYNFEKGNRSLLISGFFPSREWKAEKVKEQWATT
jgi:hypothetical protein